MFERFRAALDAAIAAAGDPGRLSRMRDAVVEARAAVSHMREQVSFTEAELEAERRHLTDAERRGRLAGQIGDEETVAVAQRFASKHAERVAVLERKFAVQRDELGLAEREISEMTEQLKHAERQRVAEDAAAHLSQAQARMGPHASPDDEVLKARYDRAARERAAEEQLQALKKKMGKE